jgi:hypothetical protein
MTVDIIENPWTVGGDVSIVTPLDEEVVDNPALLMAVTVTK